MDTDGANWIWIKYNKTISDLVDIPVIASGWSWFNGTHQRSILNMDNAALAASIFFTLKR